MYQNKISKFEKYMCDILNKYSNTNLIVNDYEKHPEINSKKIYIENLMKQTLEKLYKYLNIKYEKLYHNGIDIEFKGVITPGNAAYSVKYKFKCINTQNTTPEYKLIDLNYYNKNYDGIAFFQYLNGDWSLIIYKNKKIDYSSITEQFNGQEEKNFIKFKVDDINKFLNNYIKK